jgi:hypothetical protein
VKWLERTKRRLTMLVEGTTPEAYWLGGAGGVKDRRLWNKLDCVLTAFVRSSAGVTGMLVMASSLRLQALRMFFMRGASWRFASAFWSEGTG